MILGQKKPAPGTKRTAKPAVHRDWPPGLLPLKLLANPGDRGLGDIVERQLGMVGTAFKTAYAALLKQPCVCSNRQKWLNTRYPL